MIIGNGQIARSLANIDRNDLLILASGVADSSCEERKKFTRERQLVLNCIENQTSNVKTIYFSSCALSDDAYCKSPYYEHKKRIEELIRSKTDNYYIFRLPQVLADFKPHSTLFNFLFYSIIAGKSFNVYSKAYRYAIDIDDLALIVPIVVNSMSPGVTIDLANPARHSVLSIVDMFEKALSTKARFKIIDKEDSYWLDTSEFTSIIQSIQPDFEFGTSYLNRKILYRVARAMPG